MLWATLLSAIYSPVIDATAKEFGISHVVAAVPMATYLIGTGIPLRSYIYRSCSL
jgi:hypothetical protein